MSNPLLALLNNAGSQLSPSTSAKAPEAYPTLPSASPASASTFSSPTSTQTSLPLQARSFSGISGQLSPSRLDAAPPAFLLGLLGIAPSANAPKQGPSNPTQPRGEEATSIVQGSPRNGSLSDLFLDKARMQSPAPPAAKSANELLGLLSTSSEKSFRNTESEMRSGEPIESIHPHSVPSANPSDMPLSPAFSAAMDKATSPPVPLSSSYARAAAAPSKFDVLSTLDESTSGREASRVQEPGSTTTGARINDTSKSSGNDATSFAEHLSITTVTDSLRSLNNTNSKESSRLLIPTSDLEIAAELLASSHLAALHSAQAFGVASTSGASVLDVSSGIALLSLDLAAPQPAGLGRLHPAKLEILPVALFKTPFVHHVVSTNALLTEGGNSKAAALAPQLHACKITNLGHDVVAYVMNKGRVRLLNLVSGERAIVQIPHKHSISSIRAFAVADEGDWRLLATYHDDEAILSEALFAWKVTFTNGFLHTEALTLPVARLLACQEGSDYSYKAHLCAIQMAHRHEDVRTLRTSLLSDFQTLVDAVPGTAQAIVDVAHEHEVVASALASQEAIYVAIEAGSSYSVVITIPEDAPRRFQLPLLPEQAGKGDPVHPPVSFVSPLCDESGAELRGVVIGFARNSIIGLLDPKKEEWKYLWKFDHVPPGHFNLPILDEEHLTLFLANSVRSSMFTLPLATRSASGGEWSLLDPTGLTEFSLPAPCTSFSLAKKTGPERSNEVRVFAVHPGGVHIFDVPLPDIEAQDSLNTRPSDDASEAVSSAPGKDIDAVKAMADTAVAALEGPASRETGLAPSALPSSAAPFRPSRPTSPLTAPAPAAALPTSLSMAEQGRTHSNRRGTRGGSKHKKGTAAGSEGGAHSRTGSAANARMAESCTTGFDKEHVGTHSVAAEEITGNTSVFSNNLMQQSLDALEGRLTGSMREMLAVLSSTASPAVDSPATGLSPTDLSKLASEVALSVSAQLPKILVPQVLSSVQTIMQSEMRAGFTEVLFQHLPAELSRFMERPDVHKDISRAVSSGVIPVAQRTAVEVVTQVLAPHFEQTMGAVAQRVEATIESGMTEVRKSIVAEQSTALRSTEQQMVEMAKMMSLMSKQLSELSAENQALTAAIEELKRKSASVSKRESSAPLLPPSAAPSMSQHFSSGQTQSPWTALEPFQPQYAPPGQTDGTVAMHQHRAPLQTPFSGTYHPQGYPSSSQPQASVPPTPLSHNQLFQFSNSMSASEEEAVEDALLSALSSSEPQGAILPVLQRLKVRYGRPEAALLQRDPTTGLENSSVSQPVLLALLNTIAIVAKARVAGEGPEVWVPWAEASALRLNVRAEAIQAAYAHIADRIRRGFQEGWEMHHLKGGARWWTKERLDAYLLRYLPSPAAAK